MSVTPAGVALARHEHISIRRISEESAEEAHSSAPESAEAG
jgi:hypothetical protein